MIPWRVWFAGMGMRWLLVAGLLVGGLVGCKEASAGGGKPRVVATTTMATDLVKRIAGDSVDLHGLMGPEVDPHNYIPALPDSSLLERALISASRGSAPSLSSVAASSWLLDSLRRRSSAAASSWEPFSRRRHPAAAKKARDRPRARGVYVRDVIRQLNTRARKL